MALSGYDRAKFEEVLHARLSPTTPIRSPEYLRGREKKLEDIRRALAATGRHVFIYGDRGVGKTSLAQTAAFEHQSADHPPILLTCDPSAGFYRIAHDLVSALLRLNPTVTKQTRSVKGAINILSTLSGEVAQSIDRGPIGDLRSINEAVAAVEAAARHHSLAPVAVIDEFERIKLPEERMLFADFIKQLGDRSVPLKLVFCGIGSSLDDLLDAHHSCYRYLAAIELERLGLQGRVDIIDGARNAFNLDMDDTTRYRIAIISDGFPHYVHLVCEKIFWEVFQDPAVVLRATPMHFTAALQSAVQSIEPRLRSAYERATKKYTDDYEEVLWAVADDPTLSRRSADVFKSYCRIIALKEGHDGASRERFNARMNALKRPSHGAILKATRAGWYEFSESIVRGYVRLRAEERGVALEPDHPLLGRRLVNATP